MKMSLLQLILLGIPEGISAATLAFVLAKAEIRWNKIIIIGIILSVSAYLLRLLPITFGVHTIVYIGLLFFMLNKFAQVDLVLSSINSLLTLLCLIILETITSISIMKLLNITQPMINNNIFINMLVFYPHVLLLFFLSFLLLRLRRRMYNNELFKN